MQTNMLSRRDDATWANVNTQLVLFLWMKHDDTIHLGGPLTSMRKSTLPFRHVLFTTKLHLPVTKRMCPFSVSLSSLDYKKRLQVPQSESDKTINRIQNDTCLKPPTRWCFLIALHASQSWRGNSGEPDECWWTMQKKTRWNQGPSPFVTLKYMVESTIRNSMQASGSVSCHMKRIMPSTFFLPIPIYTI